MLVMVLVWAYANGVASSRRMEQLCGTDVAFRLICAQNLPDHATIARFRAAFADAVPVFFTEVLGLCARLMPVRGGGFCQGCNAQNVTSEDGLIIATELTNDPVDPAWFEPMLHQAQQAAALIAAGRPATSGGGTGGIGLILAGAGYCSEHNLTIAGPDRLIAIGKQRDLGKAARGQQRAGRQRAGPATTAMAERLKTEDGITAYRQRGHIAETPHGHIKHNMRFRQLSVRGKTKTAAEWAFACAVHNLLKAITSDHLTSQSLSAQPA
jgi:hypothetical protein